MNGKCHHKDSRPPPVRNDSPEAGNLQRKSGRAVPKRERAKRKWKVGFPMRDDGSKNQNTVSRCGTGVLKKIWDFPDAGQSV